MIKYLKDELKHIPTILVLIVLCYGIITLADNYLFNSSDVKYNNTTSGIQSGDVQGAIDELYACASNYAAYNNRLTSVESDKSDKSSTVSTISWDTTNKKLTKTINGSTTDVVTGATILNGLTSSQVTTALGYTPPTTDTNTWRPVQNNLTSTSTTDCLSAAQGKALNDQIGHIGQGSNKVVNRTSIYNNTISYLNNTGVLLWVRIECETYINGYAVVATVAGQEVYRREGIGSRMKFTDLIPLAAGQTITISYAETGYSGYYTIYKATYG